MECDFKMKARYTVTILLTFFLLLTACSSNSEKSIEDVTTDIVDQINSIADNVDPHVLSVKGGTLSNYPNQPIGDSFSEFFDNPTWEYFVADSGEEIVEFAGNLMYEETEVKARLQFIMHQDNTFEVGALSFNDVPQNIIVTNQMLRAVFIPEADQNEAGNQETTTVSDENDKQSDPPTLNSSAIQEKEDIFPSMSNNEKKALNIFFSNFSEVNFGNFYSTNYDDANLINFGVLHNYINNNDLVEVQDSDYVLQGEYVTKTIKKYFGLNIPNQSTDQYAYEGDNYFWPGAAGELFSNFSQVTEFIKNDDGTFTASISIYSAGLEYEGDPKIYEPMNGTWDEQFTPEYIGSASATVKGVTLNGKQTYHLLEYTLN